MGSPSPLTNPCLKGFAENLISGNDVPKGGSHQRKTLFLGPIRCVSLIVGACNMLCLPPLVDVIEERWSIK